MARHCGKCGRAGHYQVTCKAGKKKAKKAGTHKKSGRRKNPDSRLSVWNKKHPVGSTVWFWDLARPAPRSLRKGKVVSSAIMLSTQDAVVEVLEPLAFYARLVNLQQVEE